MSISMKSSKSQMYSEIERLRALLDGLNGQITMQAETIERRGQVIDGLQALLDETSAQNHALATQLQGRAQQTAARGDRATRMLITKRLAISLSTTVRWHEENGFEYFTDGQWVVVPRHTLAFVMRGIQS